LKSGSELACLLQACKAVVLPSVWYENQPFSIVEAFAAGKPVICSELGGMAELVKHEDRGLLVSPGDSRALASAMEVLEKNINLSKRMGRAAYEYAIAAHSPASHYAGLMAAYEKALCLHVLVNPPGTVVD
jgi:glycosyltransferase involved in cell wall biosynthesis